MFNKLQNFKEQGYILVSRLERQDAINALKEVLGYFPKFDSSLGDDSSNRSQFERFFYELRREYPKIFLMDMYGIQTLWQYIQCYKDESLKDYMGIRKAAYHIYDIIYYLYTCLPNFISLDEMPTFDVDKKCAFTLGGILLKEETDNKILKKVESGILLANDINDGWNAASIKQYYEAYKAELEREYELKNKTRCSFEKSLLKKCEEEIFKCNVGLDISIGSSVDNVSDLFDVNKQ